MNLAGRLCQLLCRQRSCLSATTRAVSTSGIKQKQLTKDDSRPNQTQHSESSLSMKEKISEWLIRGEFKGLTNGSKDSLNDSALKLYVVCCEYSDFERFKDHFKLTDTFSSWVAIVQLHVWMVHVRMMNERVEPCSPYLDTGYCVREVIRIMWKDIETRSKLLDSGKFRKKGYFTLVERFKGVVYTYNEKRRGV